MGLALNSKQKARRLVQGGVLFLVFAPLIYYVAYKSSDFFPSPKDIKTFTVGWLGIIVCLWLSGACFFFSARYYADAKENPPVNAGPTRSEWAKSRGISAIVSLALALAIFLVASFLWDTLDFSTSITILLFSVLGILTCLISSLISFIASIWHAIAGLRNDTKDALAQQWLWIGLAGFAFIFLSPWFAYFWFFPG